MLEAFVLCNVPNNLPRGNSHLDPERQRFSEMVKQAWGVYELRSWCRLAGWLRGRPGAAPRRPRNASFGELEFEVVTCAS